MSRWFCPGRIEVLGKHTDYAGGHTLVCATDRGTTVEAVPAPGTTWTVTSEGFETVEDLLHAELPQGHWARYPQTVVRRLLANFGDCAPMAITVSSNLPPASGMSSSSALVVATALAVASEAGFDQSPLWTGELSDPASLATYLACIENGSSFGPLAGDKGVGTFGGSEDHTAMICSEPGRLGMFSFCPTVLRERVALPEGWSFVVAVSGVAAEKTGAALEDYNRASLGAQELTRTIERILPGHPSLGAALRSSAEALDQLAGEVSDNEALTRRLRHFAIESETLVPQAVEALRAADMDAFAEVVARSQEAATHDLRNQVPPTTSLAESAIRLGAKASTSFGAGFGGSVWALVRSDRAESFAQAWLADHLAHHPDLTEASTLVVHPSGPARRID